MDYYLRYLKYKLKYFNLLEKTKRKLKAYIKDKDEDEKEKKVKTSVDNMYDRGTKLSSLFNIFITESLYELVDNSYLDKINNSQISDKEQISYTKKTKKNIIMNEYNLRNVEFKLKRDDPNFYIGSYTPEIIHNLESSGLDSTMIDDLIDNFNQDDIANVKFLNEQNPLYINYDNNGKIIECWVADNMYCPCCGFKSLRRYVKDNIPCIDLMCINPEHEFKNGVKFFQIKAKSKYIVYPRNKNFDYSLKQIHTGSKAIGQYIHDISKGEELYGLLIGYICIEYEKIIREPNELIRILDSSFIILPQIDIIESKVLFSNINKRYNDQLGLIKHIEPIRLYGSDQINKYYWYVDNDPINNTIEFNTNINDIIFFSSTNKNILFGKNISMEFITTDYNPISTRWNIIPNPFVV